jgi:menaquinone-dependent protoporphyrinogen oxidase
MQIYYATRDGQSRRIAEHIARGLTENRILARTHDLATAMPAAMDLAQAPLIVVVAAVRYGRHLPEADRLLAAYGGLPTPPPLAFASVNLTARKSGKASADSNPYLRKLLRRHRIAPALATALAGRLDYPRYKWTDRQIIRFIMLLTGGPTDPATSIEYTSWSAVDEFAAQISDVYRRSVDSRYAPPATSVASTC